MPFRHPSRRSRGVAIVLVMAVLAGLMALAAPFVFSMALHARSARNDLVAAQARAGAEGAVDRALAQLHRLLKAPGYDPTPDVDTLDELKVDLGLPVAGLNLQDPKGLLWSAKVEDEQGKVNLHTAPPALIGNLLGSTTLSEAVTKGAAALTVDDPNAFYSDDDPATLDGFIRVDADTVPYTHVKGNQVYLAPSGNYALLSNHREGALVYDGRATFICDYKFVPGQTAFRPFRSNYEIKAAGGGSPTLAIRPDEFARLERLVTVHAGREGAEWGHAERIREQTFDGDRQRFSVENANGFGPGTLVRFLQNGRALTYGRLAGAGANPRIQRGYLFLEQPVSVSASGSGVGNDVYVEPELQHPINVNTAPLEVLHACLMGVCLADSTTPVTQAKAWEVVNLLSQHVQPGSEDLRKVFETAHNKGILTLAQRDALFINATEPNSPKLRTATVPFCFRSYGSFTIEGAGVVNGANGTQLARHTLRQIVTLPGPPPGRFKLDTQERFQKLLDQGLGARVVTWPVPMGPSNNQFRKLGLTRQPDTQRGEVCLDVGKVGEHARFLDQWIEHCDNPTHPGYFQEGYAYRSQDYQRPGVPGANGYMPTTGVELWFKPHGGGQAFVFDQGEDEDRNRASCVYEPGRGLVVRIFDAGLEGKFIEYVYPVTLNAGDWYHLAASWRSGYPGGQEVRLDGQPLPQGNDPQFLPSTRLSGDIKEDDTDLSLDDPDAVQLPPKGAVRIGEEVIEYLQLKGGALSKLIRGSRMSAAAAHKQGELVLPYGYVCGLGQDLPVGGGLLVERIAKPSAGQWTLVTQVNHPAPPNKVDFVIHTETVKLPVLDATEFPPSGYILVSGEIVYYKSKTATSFNGLTRAESSGGTGAKARNLKHGSSVQLLSFAVDKHDQYDNSGYVQIDNEDNIADANDPKAVEWIEYAEKKTTGGNRYLAASVGANSPVSIQQEDPPKTLNNERSVYLGGFRGRMGTQKDMGHAKKAKVIPVIRMAGPQCGNAQSPVGDGVSTVSVLTRGRKDGDLRWVKHAFISQSPNWNIRYDNKGKAVSATFAGWSFEFWAGLNDFVSRRYDRNNSRYLKFPSGELPDVATTTRTVGVSRDGQQGQLYGSVDEVKLLALQSLGGKAAMGLSGAGLSAGDGQMCVETPEAYPRPGGGAYNPNWPATGGLLKIDDELVFYNSAAQTSLQYYADVLPLLASKAGRTARNPVTKQDEPHPNIMNKTVVLLSGLKRGVLGTQAADHPPNAGVMLHDAAPFTVLQGTLAALGDSFSVRDASGFPHEGYAWVGDEVVSWNERQGQSNNFTGCRPFHGRFGTPVGDHPAGEVIQALPFRYWDRRPTIEYDGAGLAYIQAGYTSTGAVWDTVELEITGAGYPLPNYVVPKVLVRFDGQPGWDTPPTNQEGGLYEFKGQGTFNLKAGAGRGAKAGQIEIRVYWDFRTGSFQPGSEWKRTFGLKFLRATYHSPLVLRRLDEVERR